MEEIQAMVQKNKIKFEFLKTSQRFYLNFRIKKKLLYKLQHAK